MHARKLLLLLVLALMTPTLFADDATDEPLQLEDIVREFVNGTAPSALIELIQSREVDFDLSEEMLDELRLAGLPAEVIQAMQARQAELAGPTPDAAVAGPEPELGPPTLRIRLNPNFEPEADGARPVVEVYNLVPPQLVEQLGLRDDVPLFTEVAVVLACRTTDHVPDHWRSKSPLGRDFVAAPRHRVLVFLPGAERTTPAKIHPAVKRLAAQTEVDAELLVLALPETIEVELEAGVAHDITLGLAVQAEKRYFLVSEVSRDGIILDGDVELAAEFTALVDMPFPGVELVDIAAADAG